MRTPSLALALLLILQSGGPLWAQAPGLLRSPAKPPQAPAAQPAPPAQTAITEFSGFIELERRGRGIRERVKKAPVLLGGGDRIHTYRKGRAVIRFQDGSQVTLHPFSIFTIQEESSHGITLSLALGKLRAFVGKLARREFRVRTPTAVASVRGTIFDVEAKNARDSLISVIEGSVAVANLRGDQVLLSANQRVEVLGNRMGRVEFFRGRRAERARDRRRRERRERRRVRVPRERLKEALKREVGFQRGRDALESRAAFDQKSALYQEGKTLIDAFGRRVRVEEYLLRPTPESFKAVTLNFRDQRLDTSTMEVTANKPLPPDLKLAGNLWFSPTPTKPEFYAVKQRWTVSNGIDSISTLAVDGDSLAIQVPGQPIFDPESGDVTFGGLQTFHQTVFGHRYKFINGGRAVTDPIYFGASRPNNPTAASGMMWHMVPIKVQVRKTADDSAVGATLYRYALRTRDGSGGVEGQMFVREIFSPNPPLAHFVETDYFINFVDTNSNGILDFPEFSRPGDIFGLMETVYEDKTAVGTWDPSLNGGKGGLEFTSDPIADSANQTALGDNKFFKDVNGNNVFDGGEPELTGGGLAILNFAKANFEDVQVSENFFINDLGQVQFFPPPPDPGQPEQHNADFFETFNFERVITSSRFPGRKIDVVMNPTLFLQSGQLRPKLHVVGEIPGSTPSF